MLLGCDNNSPKIVPKKLYRYAFVRRYIYYWRFKFKMQRYGRFRFKKSQHRFAVNNIEAYTKVFPIVRARHNTIV
jgi:hypothetical protein